MEFVTFASSPARPPQAHGAGGSREAVAEKIIRQGAAHICCNRRRRRRAAQAFRNVLQTRKVELNKERERAESTSDITGPVSAAMLCRRSRLAEGPTRRETGRAAAEEGKKACRKTRSLRNAWSMPTLRQGNSNTRSYECIYRLGHGEHERRRARIHLKEPGIEANFTNALLACARGTSFHAGCSKSFQQVGCCLHLSREGGEHGSCEGV